MESLLGGAALLERELRLERGGEDAAELREERVERFEDLIEEPELDPTDVFAFVTLEPTMPLTGDSFIIFRFGELSNISSAESSLELSRMDPGGSLLRLTLATLDASLKMSSSSSSSSLTGRTSISIAAVGSFLVGSGSLFLSFLVNFGVSSTFSRVVSSSVFNEDSADSNSPVSSLSTIVPSCSALEASSTSVVSPSSSRVVSTLVLLTTTGLMMNDPSAKVVPERASSSLVVSNI